MHECYASFMPGITLEFGLTIRHAPVSLQDIANEDPLLWEAFQNALQRRLGCQNPISPEIVSTLKDHFHGFQVSSAVLCRAKLYGVPTVAWSKRSDGTLEAYAEGYAEGASHVETTLTQTVQELIILAQVRRYQQSHMFRRSGEPHSESLTPDTLLGHALARLALGVQFLNESLEEEAGIRLVLFAGRRSSSRRYLLLQNLYCQLNLKGFSGTSSIPVPLLLGELAKEKIVALEPKSRLTNYVAKITKLAIVLLGLIVGLSTMGFDVSIVTLTFITLVQGLIYGIALALGIAFGLGGQETAKDLLKKGREKFNI